MSMGKAAVTVEDPPSDGRSRKPISRAAARLSAISGARASGERANTFKPAATVLTDDETSALFGDLWARLTHYAALS